MQHSQDQPSLASERQWFATTHWSVVLNAADSVSPEAGSALENFCRSYWYPLYVFVRRRGYDPEEAKDLTQEFFAQLLSKRLLHAVDPTKGRFRSWLLGVMKHFLAHQWTKGQALKRGGGQTVFSLDELEAENRYRLEPAGESDSEKIFDRRWAFTVLDRAAARLREEYGSAGKAELYGVLRGFVSMEGTLSNYNEAAKALQMKIGAVKSAIHRMRHRYQELIRLEIAQTVATRNEVDEEIRYLLAVVRR
jgi:DNA-directed RNA polymerase specialized sigma24 family protein